MRAPEEISLLAQLLLIGLADPFQNLTDAIQVTQFSAHLGNLVRMESDLTGCSAGIIHIQDPLVMALATGTGGTSDSGGMKCVAFEQGTAQQVFERRQLSYRFVRGANWLRLVASHLYRCYTQIEACQDISLKKCCE